MRDLLPGYALSDHVL
uniref:Uncharacterized protein n=1 Tax=Anguilla anguilla TaxID=7936 RepID=A0A0E9VMM3_ANGAN